LALDFWDNYSIRTKFIVHEKKGFFKLKVRLFFRLLSHDITEGIIHNRKFFIFAALCHIIAQLAIFLLKCEITLQKIFSQYKMRATKKSQGFKK